MYLVLSVLLLLFFIDRESSGLIPQAKQVENISCRQKQTLVQTKIFKRQFSVI